MNWRKQGEKVRKYNLYAYVIHGCALEATHGKEES